MACGPCTRCPQLLSVTSLKIDDIDVWELTKAFASQCHYCRDRLGIDRRS